MDTSQLDSMLSFVSGRDEKKQVPLFDKGAILLAVFMDSRGWIVADDGHGACAGK